ncbi:hypothetical protein SAMN04489712_12430 [Thermomonospora echinospora]|uniref:Uncharacterized protein n=1 Tax=Thermomonospora echinospora TaxID=1992 RepID=A0A1H6DY53_9ACTN|nr:hypothetical protein [Thermomonospora echinospora]SEG89693.1 hypothetical protein SAMN04489712_12430 [Thermomonospora echinospora]
MRNTNSTENVGKKARKGSGPASRFGGVPDRKSAALSRGARPNARRLPTRNMSRGR